MWRKGNPLTLLVGMQVGTATLKTVWRFLKKLKIELPYDPANAPLGVYPNDTDVMKRRAICTPMFITAMASSQTVERTKMLFNRQVGKMVHIYNGVLCLHQKE